MAMLYPTLNVVFDPSADNTGARVPEIADIFNLNTNRFGLVVAAVFGLTPDLLINRLQNEADRYRKQLEATSPQTRSNEPVDTGMMDQLRALVIEMTQTGAAGATGGATGSGATGGTAGGGATNGTGPASPTA